MVPVKKVLPLLLLTCFLKGALAGLSGEEHLNIAIKDELLKTKHIDHINEPVRVLDPVTDIKRLNGKYVAPTAAVIHPKPHVLANTIVDSPLKPIIKKTTGKNVGIHASEVKTKKKKQRTKKLKKIGSKKGNRFRNQLNAALNVLKKKAKKALGKLQKGKNKKVSSKRQYSRKWRKGRKFPRRRLRLLKWRKRKGNPKRKIMKGKKGVPVVNALKNMKGNNGINISKGEKGMQGQIALIKSKPGSQNSKAGKSKKRKSRKGKGKLKKKPRNLKPGKKTKRRRKLGRANALKGVLRYLQRRQRKRKMPTGFLRRLIGIPSKKFKGKMDLKKINLKDLIQKHANKIPMAKAKNIERKIKNIIKDAKPIKEGFKKGQFQQKMTDIVLAKIDNVMAKPSVKKVLQES